jgi:hypothetical protein
MIFNYNIFFFFLSLFLLSYNTNKRFNFIKEELSLLEALKRKLEEREDPIGRDTIFLKDL